VRNLLRIRNARIYLIGDVVSSLGDYSLWLAMAIWVKEMTGSSAWAGLVMFCFALGNLFSPLGGILADRFRRRPLLIALNLTAAALVLLLLLVHGRSTMWLVFAVMFGYGLAGSAMGPAQTALLPAIVPADLLADANAAQQTLVQGLRLVTPLVGAGLFVWLGAGAVAVIDAATFCVAVACLAALRVTEPAPGAAPVEPGSGAEGPSPAGAADGGSSAGFRYLAAEPVLRAITITLALVLLTLGFTESAGFSVVTAGLHRSASFVGVLGTFQGAGAIAGGILAAPLLKRTSESRLVMAGLALLAIAMVLLTVPNVFANVAAMLIVGPVGPWLMVAAMTALQTRTPAELMGRVAGVFQLALGIPQIASIGLGAALIAFVNYRVLLAAIAVVAVIAAGYLLSVPESRRRDVPAGSAEPEPEPGPEAAAASAQPSDR
jgi:MFS family permease